MTDQEQSLETVLTDYIKTEPVSFEQKTDDIGFSMPSLKSAFKVNRLLPMAIGSAASGLIAGTIASFIPIGVLTSVAGAPAIIAGLLAKMTIAKGETSTISRVADGVLIAGISQTISRFIPSSFGQELSSKVQEEFKQEKPCQEQMKGDGIQW